MNVPAVVSVVHAKTTTTPVDPFEAQNNIGRTQSRTQSNACARARMALALGKLNFSCAVIGLTFINRACRQNRNP